MAVSRTQLQPQPPPAPPSPPTDPSRMESRWGRWALPLRPSICMAGWPRRPRCQGLTVAQPARVVASRQAASRQVTARAGRRAELLWRWVAGMAWLEAIPSNLQRALWPTGGRGQGGQRLARSWLLIALLSLAPGCVESGLDVPIPESDPGVEPSSFAEIQTMIFEPMCALSCHRSGAAPKGLSLQANTAHKHLVNVAAAEAPGLMRVAPGLPDQSYLVIKVASSDPRRKGARMPRNGPPWVSRAQIRALRRWITAGAKDDWVASDEEVDVLQVPFDGAGGMDAGAADVVDDAANEEMSP